MTAGTRARPCVLDTSLILTLAAVDRLDIALANERYQWHITPMVRGEIRTRETRLQIDGAIAPGGLRIAELDLTSETEARSWAHWSTVVDPGEAEAIALATSRGWLIALEDRQAQRALDRLVGAGRWLNCVNLLLHAVADGRISESDGDDVFRRLDCHAGYARRGVIRLKDVPAPHR